MCEMTKCWGLEMMTKKLLGLAFPNYFKLVLKKEKFLLDRTYSETWVHHYTPKLKHVNIERRMKDRENSVRAKTRLSAEKMLAIPFGGWKTLLVMNVLHWRRTFNATLPDLRGVVPP
ncbi:hypothetical protein Trydic_g3905 [Trypoxylus dichotomus]